jgi:hypothetical protein
LVAIPRRRGDPASERPIAPPNNSRELGGDDNGRVRKRVLVQLLSGTADANIRFEDLRSLLHALGFAERIKGDHHIYSKDSVIEILNLQPRGSFAKPYQVRQVRAVLVRYKLAQGIE